MARERPFAAAAAAAGAAAAGLFLWSKRTQINDQLSSLSEQFGQWTDNMRTSGDGSRSEEHTSELQSLRHLVCPLLLEKKKNPTPPHPPKPPPPPPYLKKTKNTNHLKYIVDSILSLLKIIIFQQDDEQD